MRRSRHAPILLTASALVLAGALTVPATADDDGGTGKGGFAGQARSERRVAAQDALERAEAVFGGKATRAERRSATIVLRDLRMAMDDLSTAERKRARSVLEAPTTATTTTEAEGSPACSDRTCVHYLDTAPDAPSSADGDADGTPDYVETVLATIDHVRGRYVAAGYRAPLPDGASSDPDLRPNPDDRFDVYLADLGADGGLYGFCDSDDPKLESPTVNFDVSGYCVLDNDYLPSQYAGAPAMSSLKATVAHEYFHAVQFAYDYLEDGWIMEATAAWAEDEVYTTINDNRQYLSWSPIRYPTVPLDYGADDFYYGTWIFFRYLSEKFPKTAGGMPIIVRDIWRLLDSSDGARDYYSIAGVTKSLRLRDTTLPRVLATFAVANRLPKLYYSEGSAYPAAPYKGVSVTRSRLNPAALGARLDHLTSATVRYVPKRLTGTRWRLKLAFNLQNRARGSAAVIRVVKASGKSVVSHVSLNSSGNATVRLRFGNRDVRAVEVTLLNASARFDCWYAMESPYSCFGKPLDENLLQVVDARAYRS